MDDKIRKSLVSEIDDKSELLLSTFAEIGIKTGDLSPLSDLLESTFRIDCSIRRLLIKMISHSHDLDYVLEIRKHPKLKGNAKPEHQKLEKVWKDIEIAVWMLSMGVDNKDTYSYAIKMASNKFNLEYGSLANIWTKYQKAAKYHIQQIAEAEPLHF